MSSLQQQGDVSRSVAATLSHICAANRSWAAQHSPDDLLSCFDCSTPPAVSISNYMRKLARVGGAEYWPQCLILIDELSRTHRVPVSTDNVHRLVVTTYCLVLKLAIDGTGILPLVAQAGGISIDDLAEMEAALLQLLDWRVAVGAAAHDKLVANCRAIRETARNAAASPRDGPVTLIPGALVPIEERFSFETPAAAAPKQPDQEACSGEASTNSAFSNAEEAAEQSRVFLPRPPKQCAAGGYRPRICPREEPVAQGEAACMAGKRIASARAFAQATDLVAVSP